MSITKQRTLDYVERFNRLPKEEQSKRIEEMGFESLHDLLAHILAWWDCRSRRGARIIMGILDSPAFTWQDPETDSFNVELVEKYSTWSDDGLYRHFETVRLALIDLISGLPEDTFTDRDIEDWLVSDVVKHYEEHPIPA